MIKYVLWHTILFHQNHILLLYHCSDAQQFIFVTMGMCIVHPEVSCVLFLIVNCVTLTATA